MSRNGSTFSNFNSDNVLPYEEPSSLGGNSATYNSNQVGGKKLKKGSKSAKIFMAKLRAMRKNKNKKMSKKYRGGNYEEEQEGGMRKNKNNKMSKKYRGGNNEEEQEGDNFELKQEGGNFELEQEGGNFELEQEGGNSVELEYQENNLEKASLPALAAPVHGGKKKSKRNCQKKHKKKSQKKMWPFKLRSGNLRFPEFRNI
jgi:hypothetical protein